MTENQSQDLDTTLCKWHQWQQSKCHTGRGFNSKSLVVGDFIISRQYDDGSDMDRAVDNATMKVVEFHVTEMRDPWKAAIYANARALVTGAVVFSSPRLPESLGERMMVVSEARDILARRLVTAGVI